MKVIVINSSDVYNLGAARVAQYYRMQGHEVVEDTQIKPMFDLDADRFMFSVIFTYDIPNLIKQVNMVKHTGAEIEIGGPAATAMPDYIESQAGVKPVIGLDERFEHVPGRYQATFSSRGCPRNCPFCLVPRLEGRRIVEYDSFPIPVGKNPYLCDNNILATSWSHQRLVVEKLKHVRNIDLNSGFDCRIFCKDPEKYWGLYRELHMEMWRFAYDVPEEKEPVERCVKFLRGKGVDYRHISVFCLVGFPRQTFDQCLQKLKFLVKIECSPYPMRFKPLESLTKEYNPPGWQDGQLEKLFLMFGVPWRWRSIKWEDLRQSYQKEEEWKRSSRDFFA